MGEAKRKKQLLGKSYGLPDINSQISDAWETINTSIARAEREGNDCIICQCCRNDKGFHPDAISAMTKQLENWNCPLKNVLMIIQMQPRGFRTSESKLFDGFVTVWSNEPGHVLWNHLFETKLK